MKKHEVQTLSGWPLDHAVAILFNVALEGRYTRNWQNNLVEWRPSTDYNQGSPYLHTNFVATSPTPQDKSVWRASMEHYVAHGPTALVAGLRVLLLRRYGTFVEVPEGADEFQ